MSDSFESSMRAVLQNEFGLLCIRFCLCSLRQYIQNESCLQDSFARYETGDTTRTLIALANTLILKYTMYRWHHLRAFYCVLNMDNDARILLLRPRPKVSDFRTLRAAGRKLHVQIPSNVACG